MNPMFTGSIVGINIGGYSDLENPWIWASLFLFIMWCITLWMWSKRSKESYKLNEKVQKLFQEKQRGWWGK